MEVLCGCSLGSVASISPALASHSLGGYCHEPIMAGAGGGAADRKMLLLSWGIISKNVDPICRCMSLMVELPAAMAGVEIPGSG